MKKRCNKKGLSTVIITVLLVGLSIVAVGVGWVVINNILQSGTESIESSTALLNLQLELQNAKVENSNLVVTV